MHVSSPALESIFGPSLDARAVVVVLVVHATLSVQGESNVRPCMAPDDELPAHLSNRLLQRPAKRECVTLTLVVL